LEDKPKYALNLLTQLREAYEGVYVLFPDDLGVTPYTKPYISYIWDPVVDGERFLLRFHLFLPDDFGSPFCKIKAPVVEFWHASIHKKSWAYKNSIPHTYAVDAAGRNNLEQYPWVTVCWHYPGDTADAWKNWINIEWSYEEGLNPAFEAVCEWLRAYLGWLEFGKWFYGGIRHKPDRERIKKDEQAFRRDNLTSASASALATGQTLQDFVHRWRWNQRNTASWHIEGNRSRAL